MADEYMDSIMAQLPSLDAVKLGKLIDHFNITIAEGKKGKKGAMVSAVLKHVSRDELEESEDQGEAELREIDCELGKLLKGQLKNVTDGSGSTNGDVNAVSVKTEEKDLVKAKIDTKLKTDVDSGSSNGDEGNNAGDMRLKLLKGLKLREFKLNGAVGTEEGCIDYQQLTYQMQQGKEDGYTFKEVMFGVIKGMKNASMKKFFQGKVFGKAGKNITEDKFIQMLRSKYMVEDSQKIYNKMLRAKQEPKETEMDFLHKMMHLRDTVIELSEDEESPCNVTGLQKKFLHALSVGFSNNTVRLDLRQVLKDESIEDDELMEEVSLVMQRESEYEEKFGKKSAKVNSVDCSKKDDEAGAKATAENQVLAEIKQLTVKVGEMGKVSSRVDKLTAEVDSLKQVVANVCAIAAPGYVPHVFPTGPAPALPQIPAVGGNGGNRRFSIKCRNCEEQRIYCNHCNICGLEGHKRRNCPTGQATPNV